MHYVVERLAEALPFAVGLLGDIHIRRHCDSELG